MKHWKTTNKQEEQNENILAQLKKTVDLTYKNSKDIDCLGENTETLKNGIQADIKYTRDTLEFGNSKILSRTDDIKKQLQLLLQLFDLNTASESKALSNIKHDITAIKESIIQIQNITQENKNMSLLHEQNKVASGCQIV